VQVPERGTIVVMHGFKNSNHKNTSSYSSLFIVLWQRMVMLQDYSNSVCMHPLLPNCCIQHTNWLPELRELGVRESTTNKKYLNLHETADVGVVQSIRKLTLTEA
jgi:hypothetical protein